MIKKIEKKCIQKLCLSYCYNKEIVSYTKLKVKLDQLTKYLRIHRGEENGDSAQWNHSPENNDNFKFSEITKVNA